MTKHDEIYLKEDWMNDDVQWLKKKEVWDEIQSSTKKKEVWDEIQSSTKKMRFICWLIWLIL